MGALRTITPTIARRLVITRQRLSGGRPAPNAEGIKEILGDLRCVQIDPIRAVERTQLLVLWSRLGLFEPAELDTLLYQDRHLFEYWAHAASIVRTEDYPIFQVHMRNWPYGFQTWTVRVKEWMVENEALAAHILAELEERGPLAKGDFVDVSTKSWDSSGWTDGQNVGQMLNYLWLQGKILVKYRKGLAKVWDLSDRCLPGWAPREELSWPEVVYRAAQYALRALGVATKAHIERHFTRGKYPDLDEALVQLEKDGLVARVQISEAGRDSPGPWYVHAADLPLLDDLEGGAWQPRTTLLSPFDNLICDRDRTEELFGFHYRIEIYVPKAKRQYGYYVMPILHGDRLIGRVDPKMDRKTRRLRINRIHVEDEALATAESGQALHSAIQNLGEFLGAQEIEYGEEAPAGWRTALR
jgi:uncharacterized protein YcaQ